jgi:predicted DNA binding protein
MWPRQQPLCMLQARFAAELPPDAWTADVSRSFPAAELRLLTGITVGETAVELGEVRGGPVDAVDAAIADHPQVLEHERLYRDEDRAVAQYRTTERSLYAFLRRSSVPPEFPVVVSDGWYRFSVTAPREQVREVRAVLEASDRPYEVLALVDAGDAEGLLTDRQRDLLETALRAGYFEVPRETDLGTLSEEFDISEQALSERLRRGVSSVLASTVGEPTEPQVGPVGEPVPGTGGAADDE